MAADFRIMGVVNVTPDSFSDGGRFLEPAAALAHARRMAGEGADILDIGGESTRPPGVRGPEDPGAAPVSAEEELSRVLPVIEGLAAAGTDAQISIDT
jgi:dihydropteroate synthase